MINALNISESYINQFNTYFNQMPTLYKKIIHEGLVNDK